MSSTPSQQKCAVWPMHEDMMQRIIAQRVDETSSLKYAEVVSGIGARSRSLFRENDTRCLEERKSAARMMLSYDGQEVPATGVGIGSLLKGRLGYRPRRHCVLKCGSVLQRRTGNSERRSLTRRRGGSEPIC